MKPPLSTAVLLFLAVLYFAVGIHNIFFEGMAFRSDEIIGDVVDNRLNLYFYEHGFQFFTGQVDSFWNLPSLYPIPLSMGFSDTLLGTQPFYAAFRLSGYTPETSFQYLTVLIFIINYLVTFVVLRKLKFHPIIVLSGAYLFTFSPAVINSFYHIQLLPRYFIPLCLFAIYKLLQDGFSRKYYVLFVFSYVSNFYNSPYLGFLLTLGLGITFIYLIYISGLKQFWLELIVFFKHRYTLLISLAGLIFFGVLMVPYFQASRIAGGGWGYGMLQDGLPRLRSYLLPNLYSVWWGTLGFLGDGLPLHNEHRVFNGILITLSVLILPLIYWLHKKGKLKTSLRYKTELQQAWQIYIISILLVISTLYILPYVSLYIPISFIPGYNSLRAVVRIIFVLLCFWIAAVGFLYSEPLRKLSFINQTIAGLIICSLVCVDTFHYKHKLPFVKKSLVEERSSEIVRIIRKKQPEVFAYTVRNVEDNIDTKLHKPAVHHLDAMLAAQATNTFTINSFSGKLPSSFHGFVWKLNEEELRVWLKKNGVKFSEVLIIENDNGILSEYFMKE